MTLHAIPVEVYPKIQKDEWKPEILTELWTAHQQIVSAGDGSQVQSLVITVSEFKPLVICSKKLS